MKDSKILYLVPDLIGPPGGIGRYGRLVCRALLGAQRSVDVISLLDKEPAKGTAAETMPGARYSPCGGSRWRFVNKSIGTALRQRPNLVICGHANFGPLAATAARLARAPYGVFIYGIEVWEPLSPLRKRALQNAAVVWSISAFTARRAVQTNGLNPDRVRILHNCLDPEFRPPSQVLFKRAPTLLTVSRLSRAEQYKGHDYIIRALPALRKQFPNLTYAVVGDGDWMPDLQRLARDCGVEESVRFHGFISNAELENQYRQAAVYAMPSRGEGFGFVFLEAMAYGLPVVGGNVDATAEVVENGTTGIIVDPQSAADIAQAIGQLLENPELRVQMGQAGQERVASLFGFDRFQETFLTYLQEMGA